MILTEMPLSVLPRPGDLVERPTSHTFYSQPPPSSTASRTATHDTSNLSMQVEDVLVHIFRTLDLDDLHSLRLVSKRLRSLIDSKIVWADLLRRLALPLPVTRVPLLDLEPRELERLAVRAVRLEANWSSSQPRPSAIRKVALESTIVVMAACRGAVFTAHKTGTLRCWRDLDSLRSHHQLGFYPLDEDRFSVKITPEERIVKFTHIQACVDTTEKYFILAYAGDGLDRRSHSGVHYIPVDPNADIASAPTPIQTDISRGVVSMSITPSKLVTARAQGEISVLDLHYRHSTFTIETEPLGCGSSNKLLRIHALGFDRLLVLSSTSVAVYRMPTAEEPAVEHPCFTFKFPPSVSAWVMPSSSPRDITFTILTETSEAIRYNLSCPTSNPDPDDEHRDEAETWEVVQVASGAFPYPLERLNQTELYGGTRRSVWVHFRRGSTEGWPIHMFSNDVKSVPSSTDHMARPPSTEQQQALEFRSMAAINSTGRLSFPQGLQPPSKEDTISFSQELYDSTRSMSLPRICFDEASGRMYLAGLSSPTLSICDFA